MIRFFQVLIVFLSLAHSSGAQELSKQALIEDITAYRDAINEHHVDPYTIIKKSSFYSEIEALQSKADRLNEDELLIGLMQINAHIGDAHTAIISNAKTLFPLRAFRFKEGFYILKIDSTYSELQYAKILAIDGMPVDNVLSKLLTIIPSSNKSWINEESAKYLSDPIVLHGLGITKNRDAANYKLQLRDGSIKEASLSPMLYSAIRFTQVPVAAGMLRYSRPGNYWYTITGHTAYIKYNRCLEDRNMTFTQTLMNLEKEGKEAGINKMVIDLRDNAGGSELILRNVLPAIARSDIARQHHLYALIGRRTFSSAALNAGDLKKIGAILVGEETGGDANHFGEIQSVQLPRSGLRVVYSTKHFIRDPTISNGILPDIPIEETFSSFIQGQDDALKYILTQ